MININNFKKYRGYKVGDIIMAEMPEVTGFCCENKEVRVSFAPNATISSYHVCEFLDDVKKNFKLRKDDEKVMPEFGDLCMAEPMEPFEPTHVDSSIDVSYWNILNSILVEQA